MAFVFAPPNLSYVYRSSQATDFFDPYVRRLGFFDLGLDLLGVLSETMFGEVNREPSEDDL